MQQYDINYIQLGGIIFENTVIKSQRYSNNSQAKDHKHTLALHMPGLTGADSKGMGSTVDKSLATAHKNQHSSNQPPVKIFQDTF